MYRYIQLFTQFSFMVLSFLALATSQTIPLGTQGKLIGVTNASFALHQGELFPSFNPAFLAKNSGSNIWIISFYRRLNSILGYENEHASNFHTEASYFRDSSSLSLGFSRQNHSIEVPKWTEQDPSGESGTIELNFTSTENHVSYAFARNVSSTFSVGIRLSYYYTNMGPESTGMREYNEKNHTLSLDAGILVYPIRNFTFGLNVSDVTIRKVDYLIFDSLYSGGIIRGPTASFNLNVLYQFGDKVILSLEVKNLFENGLQEPKTRTVREGNYYYVVFDGFISYPVKRSYYGAIEYKVLTPLTLHMSLFRYSAKIPRYKVRYEETGLSPRTVYSIGAQLTHNRMEVSVSYVFDGLKEEINEFEYLEFNQSFPPIVISVGWQL